MPPTARKPATAKVEKAEDAPVVVPEQETTPAPEAPVEGEPTPEAAPEPTPEPEPVPVVVAAPVAATAPLDAPKPPPTAATTSYLPTPSDAAALRAAAAAERILDDETGRTPVLDGLFVPYVEGGSLFRCTRRLLRETAAGYHHVTTVLLAPEGSDLTADAVNALTALILAQSEAA